MRVIAPLALCVACTDPASVGPPPAFVTLERAASIDGLLTVIPLDPTTCPAIEPPDPSWTRQPVTGSTATLAVAPQLTRESAGFGARPGRVFVDRWLGLAAVTFDDDLARYTPAPLVAGGLVDRGRLQEVRFFDARCALTIDGRPATLLVRLVPAQRPDGSLDFARFEPGLPAAVVRTGPDGRRATVMVAEIDGASRPLRTNPGGRALIAMAATLRW